ncbi:hypothetical protein [Candidatus Tisiphia endosymbiont of Nedyus quadrimaculatus]
MTYDPQTVTALKLLAENATFEYIAKVTGLTIEEIQKLKSSN